LEDYIPLYLNLLSVTSDAFPFPRHLQGELVPAAMMEAVVAILTMQAKRTPTILLLEDWHWADDGSRMVLRQLQEIVPAYPLFLVVSSRPDPSIEWGSGDHQTLMHLGPLNAVNSLAVMKSVLGVERISEQLVNNVMERAGGNPFFLEEICQTLVETGIAGTESGVARVADATGIVQLPHTVQAVIRTRVDCLDPDAREVLRVASVIGLEFGRGILEEIADSQLNLPQALDRLKASGLLQQTSVGPEPAYRFKHVLTQEVAYDSLLEHQRTLLHDAAGRAMERLYPDRIDEHVELLARHFSRAERWPKAIQYSIQAAERAAKLSRFAEALNTLDRAQEWLARIPDNEDHRDLLQKILFRQERLSETLGLRDRQQRIVDDLIGLLTPQGESKLLAEAYLRKGDVCTLLRQFEAADTALDTSLRTSRSCEDSTGERQATRSLGLLRWHEGKSDAALDLVEQALFLDRERGDEEAVEGDLSNIGQILKGIGQHERALQAFEEALEISIRLRDPVKQSYILHGLGNVHHALGNTDKALECFHQADEIARSRKLPLLRTFQLTSIAHLKLQQGHVEESLQLYREAVEVSRRLRHADGLAQSLRMLGELLFGLGRDAEALPIFTEGATLFAQLEHRDAEAFMRSRLATVCERLERYDDAVGAWQSVHSLYSPAGDAQAELSAAEGMARAN
ncbi:MAG: ATP-binding protein, partial [Gemmatimonadaceae bacterium]